MSSKKKKEKGESVIQQEEKMKALILADSFSNEYKPLTLDKPRVLQVIFSTQQFFNDVIGTSTLG